MEKHFFRYQILRYIADLRRMETENFGIVVQSEHGVSCRFRTSLGPRRDFDFDNYRRWREFFVTEIKQPAVPFFQPQRTSLEFLTYLQERCRGNYSLTRPLELVLDTPSLEDAESYLFGSLVLKPDDAVKSIQQPVQQFRHELDERGILDHPEFHIKDFFKAQGLNELVGYYYTRNHGADLSVIIQSVQYRLDPTITGNQMERAEAVVATLQAAKVKSEINVVVDTIPEPAAKDNDAKKWAYERVEKGKQNLSARDVKVIDSKRKATKLVDIVQHDLDDITLIKPQIEMALP